ncbi:carbohydrate kinase family protein [Actinopolymorpha pittospori]
MVRIAVIGHTNIETAVHADHLEGANSDEFVAYALSTTVSGVGVNVALALKGLGADVRLATVVGRDVLGGACVQELTERGLDPAYLVRGTPVTAQSLSRHASDGSRRNLVDLKDVQGATYPDNLAPRLLDDVAVAVVCNIAYARPMLRRARERHIPIASDVHAVTGLDDAYNHDWIACADVLFASHERLDVAPSTFARTVLREHRATVVVVGMGADGALLGVRGEDVTCVPAVRTRPVVSTVGAGDALFSAFVDGWVAGMAPRDALRRATLFASWKIGASGGAAGLLDQAGLAALAGTWPGSPDAGGPG